MHQVHCGLERAVEMLTDSPAPATVPLPPRGVGGATPTGPVHANVMCDLCNSVVVGARYKCG